MTDSKMTGPRYSQGANITQAWRDGVAVVQRPDGWYAVLRRAAWVLGQPAPAMGPYASPEHAHHCIHHVVALARTGAAYRDQL